MEFIFHKEKRDTKSEANQTDKMACLRFASLRIKTLTATSMSFYQLWIFAVRLLTFTMKTPLGR